MPAREKQIFVESLRRSTCKDRVVDQFWFPRLTSTANKTSKEQISRKLSVKGVNI
jgi:hypothetical protein